MKIDTVLSEGIEVVDGVLVEGLVEVHGVPVAQGVCLEEAAHDGVEVAGAVVVEVGFFVVAAAMEEEVVAHGGVGKDCARGICDGGHAVGVVGYSFDYIAGIIGYGSDGADAVFKEVVGNHGDVFIPVYPDDIVDTGFPVIPYSLLFHLIQVNLIGSPDLKQISQQDKNPDTLLNPIAFQYIPGHLT